MRDWRTRVAPSREEIDRQLRESEEALRRAREESRRIARTLEQSERVRREALPKLKKAGQVR